MSVRFSWRYTRVVALATLIWVFASVAAFAQFPGGPPPGGPGGPPPGGPFGGPGGGPFGGGALRMPIEALAAGLRLTASQKTQISQIQKQADQDMRSLMPPPGEGPPDRDAMEKVRSLNEKATNQIKAVLTADQQKALPSVLREIQTLNSVGIPAALMGDLKLTSDQKEKIAGIARESQAAMQQKMEEARQSGDPDSMRQAFQQARRQTHEQAMAVLTDSQKSKVTAYISAHPQRRGGPGFGPGGPGGPGGPPPGGPGGPPPPGGDGPGGPPPGGDPNGNN